MLVKIFVDAVQKQIQNLAALVLIAFSFAEIVQASPHLAVEVSNHCGACHQPGRAELKVLDRRCTLDCQGCHIDPSGAGPRNQWGTFFSWQHLSTVGFLAKEDPLKDRSRVDLHLDTRVIHHQSGGRSHAFPMNSELSLRLRPFVRWLHLTYQGSFLGRAWGHANVQSLLKPDRLLSKYALMVDQLPLNTYIRLFKGEVPYGLRHTNHSRWARERLGFGPRQGSRGITFGGTPTVPFMHFTYMLGDEDKPEDDRQIGSTVHAGMRGVSLGWNLHGSYWKSRSASKQISMLGLGGGIKYMGFIASAETHKRDVTGMAPTSSRYPGGIPSSKLQPSAKVSDASLAYAFQRGILLTYVNEVLETELQKSQRHSLFVDLHPLPFLQFEFWRRLELGARKVYDSIAIGHIYWDF